MHLSTSLVAVALVAAVSGVTATAAGQSAPAKWADTISAEIEKAYESGDLQQMQAARALAERVATAFPHDGLMMHYEGYALYREASAIASRGNMRDATPVFTRALAALEQSLATHPLPETQALMSTIDGNLIAGDPSRAMELGMASQQAQAAATALGPKNPRVWLIRGISAIFTPPEYGGGLAIAEDQLKHAIALFPTDTPAPGDPSWGYAEAYLWLGQTYDKLKDRTKAAEAYKRAVQIAPNFRWARSLADAAK